jgi:hypothetical protein
MQPGLLAVVALATTGQVMLHPRPDVYLIIVGSFDLQ